MEWYLFALIAACAFGIGDVVRKKALVKEHTHQFLTTFYLLHFFLVLLFLPKVNFQLEAWQWGMMYLKSLFLTFALVFMMSLLRHYELSEVMPLKNLSSFFLLLLGFLLLREMPSAINLGGIGLLLIGTYVIEANHTSDFLRPLNILKSKKALYVLFYAILISFSALSDKYIVNTMDIYTYLAMTIFFMAMNFLIIQLIFYEGVKDIKQALKRDGLVILLAAAIYFIAEIFYLSSVAAPASLIVLIIPLIRLSTLISIIIGGGLFHEHCFKTRIIAGLIMVAGVFLVVQ